MASKKWKLGRENGPYHDDALAELSDRVGAEEAAALLEGTIVVVRGHAPEGEVPHAARGQEGREPRLGGPRAGVAVLRGRRGGDGERPKAALLRSQLEVRDPGEDAELTGLEVGRRGAHGRRTWLRRLRRRRVWTVWLSRRFNCGLADFPAASGLIMAV